MTSRISCDRFEEHLSDYLEGALARSDAAAFGEHALQCRACRALLDDVRAAVNQCRENEASELSQVPTMLEASLLGIAEEYRSFDCRAFEELITEFLDGFVPAATYHRFEEHAARCVACSSLLTDVVFAVAACHSVHIYEEVEPAESLNVKLAAILSLATPRSAPSPYGTAAWRKWGRFGVRITAFVARRLPRATTAPRWSFATAASIAGATLMLLLYGFSDDRSIAGIYRQAQCRFAQLYSQTADIYAQKDAVAARIERVEIGLDEIWDGLGGEKPSEIPPGPERKSPGRDAEKSAPPQRD